MGFLKYIGKKEVRDDNVGGTDTVWLGNGDIQQVPDALLPKFRLHPSTWEEVAAPGSLGDAEKTDGKPGEFVLLTSQGTELDLGTLDDKHLRNIVREAGLTVHHAKKGNALRAAICEGVRLKAEEAAKAEADAKAAAEAAAKGV